MRLIFEAALCAMAIGTFATVVVHVLQSEWNVEAILGGLLLGGAYSVLFAPISFGVIPLDENMTNTLDAWPGIISALCVLLAISAGQKPLPETAAAVRGLGVLCRVILGIYKYACLLWLLFLPVGTVLGAVYILFQTRRQPQPSVDDGTSHEQGDLDRGSAGGE
ncbi:MAG: hypothetical protein EBZ59_06785 [Planctomycetia bacterium]|nr:hypothetical protein [Planctomycetia bacterium]